MFKQKKKKGIKGKEIKSYLYLSRKTTRGRGARGKFFLKELEYLFFSWHISSKSFISVFLISVTIFNVKRKKNTPFPANLFETFHNLFFHNVEEWRTNEEKFGDKKRFAVLKNLFPVPVFPSSRDWRFRGSFTTVIAFTGTLKLAFLLFHFSSVSLVIRKGCIPGNNCVRVVARLYFSQIHFTFFFLFPRPSFSFLFCFVDFLYTFVLFEILAKERRVDTSALLLPSFFLFF